MIWRKTTLITTHHYQIIMTPSPPEPFIEPEERIANSLAELMKHHGPCDVTMLVAYLHDFSNVQLLINDDCYNPPISWVAGILSKDERFVKDGSDRWHLTDEIDAEPHTLEETNQTRLEE